MKYFIDTEFIEGFHKPMFGKRRHFIDLISIGIVREDGKSYYAISDEYEYKMANNWVKENVIKPMYIQEVHGDLRNRVSVRDFHKVVGRPLAKIKDDILHCFGCWRDTLFWRAPNEPIEIYGYYCDYDWVVFCSLFGAMIDLPKGFPMYCRDLKQELDRKSAAIAKGVKSQDIFSTVTLIAGTGEAIGDSWKRLDNEEKVLKSIKDHKNYPKQLDEHNALADAKWNLELYKFLNTL